MKFNFFKILLVTILLMLPVAASAQIDNFGVADTIYAEIAKINDLNWSITLIYANDENVEGFSIPFKMTSGLNRIVADSVIYTGSRVEHFAYKTFRPDTAIQCVTIGLIANLGPTRKMVTPGKGRIATIFVSSLDDKPIETLSIDTTTTKHDTKINGNEQREER